MNKASKSTLESLLEQPIIFILKTHEVIQLIPHHLLSPEGIFLLLLQLITNRP